MILPLFGIRSKAPMTRQPSWTSAWNSDATRRISDPDKVIGFQLKQGTGASYAQVMQGFHSTSIEFPAAASASLPTPLVCSQRQVLPPATWKPSLNPLRYQL